MQAPVRRYAVVDVLRGVAILLMFVFHFSWDLSYFGFADFQISTDPFWIWFARSIAGTILLVMGISQAVTAAQPFDRQRFIKRFIVIAVSASTISAGTYMMDPNTFIFFGILHHIALVSLIMPLLIRQPTQMIAALAAICFIAPYFFVHEVFLVEWLWWVGLSPVTPLTNDYVPLMPWLGMSLIGVIVGQYLFVNRPSTTLGNWQPASTFAHMTQFAGRHSLVLYMVHQPILFGGTYAVYWMLHL